NGDLCTAEYGEECTWCTDECVEETITGGECGDGTPDPGEDCDDGNNSNSDDCLNTCVDAECGDGYVHSDDEDCDDGNNSNSDDCLNTCVDAECGDGYVHSDDEDCDDGAQNGDVCTPPCTYCSTSCEEVTLEGGECGDGTQDAGEECDDGNNEPLDGCSSACIITHNECARDGSFCWCKAIEGAGEDICDDHDGCWQYTCIYGVCTAGCGTGVDTCEVHSDCCNQTECDACIEQCYDMGDPDCSIPCGNACSECDEF
ncbi:MAG: hypothetical protein P9L98_02380, partial [Candidatus Kaelpia imicola]|nr:hypothetical protein [Candidatus Kaelpia imicola]